MSEVFSTGLMNWTADSSGGRLQTGSEMPSSLLNWSDPGHFVVTSFHGTVTSPSESFEFSLNGDDFDTLRKWLGCILLIQLEDDSLENALLNLGDIYGHQQAQARILAPARHVVQGRARVQEGKQRPGMVVLE